MKSAVLETSNSSSPADEETSATGELTITTVAEKQRILAGAAAISGDTVLLDSTLLEGGDPHRLQINSRSSEGNTGSWGVLEGLANLVSDLVTVPADRRSEGRQTILGLTAPGIEFPQESADHPGGGPSPTAVGNPHQPLSRIGHHHQWAVCCQGQDKDSSVGGDGGIRSPKDL